MRSSSTLPAAQRAALLSSPGPARFKHFVGRAADTERIWGLRNAGGWAVLAGVWSKPSDLRRALIEALGTYT